MIAADGTAVYPWNHGETLTAASLNAAVSQSSIINGGTITGELQVNVPTGTQAANFFRYGYGATVPLVNIQSAGTDGGTTNFHALTVQEQATQDDGPTGAQGTVYASLAINGRSRTDLYAIHALTYVNNAASSLTPYPGDGSSQHGAVCAQTVKTLPSGGYATGAVGPDAFTHWWQTINQTNLGSAASGGDLCLEADIAANGPDDIWKLGPLTHTGNTVAGSPTITGIANTTGLTVGQYVNVAQAGDNYVMCRIVSTTGTSITVDINIPTTITGAIIAPQGGTRFSFQNTLLPLPTAVASGGKRLEWYYGHYQNNVYGDTVWGVGFAYYGQYFVAASDYSMGGTMASPYSADGNNRGVAIKLKAGQKVALDGDGYHGTWLTGITGGGLNIVKDGANLTSFDASGNASVTGGLTTNGPLQGGLGGADVLVGTQTTTALTATAGYLIVPYCLGTPTGVPVNHSKGIALVYDVSSHRLWAYENNAWHYSQFT